jgi:hypothetical protein
MTSKSLFFLLPNLLVADQLKKALTDDLYKSKASTDDL